MCGRWSVRVVTGASPFSMHPACAGDFERRKPMGGNRQVLQRTKRTMASAVKEA
ncbi:hypothetical protein AKJ09_04723 [Labilithrix luteola]|uniref:Uncharacterized protein n=1 Tax=Labilithrix luteola TaxID=1391654 RepID=A0A0K1PY35_9BACT|nr:hypothetical protein AKJ09_04723 [Labilithrix luteola]